MLFPRNKTLKASRRYRFVTGFPVLFFFNVFISKCFIQFSGPAIPPLTLPRFLFQRPRTEAPFYRVFFIEVFLPIFSGAFSVFQRDVLG